MQVKKIKYMSWISLAFPATIELLTVDNGKSIYKEVTDVLQDIFFSNLGQDQIFSSTKLSDR